MSPSPIFVSSLAPGVGKEKIWGFLCVCFMSTGSSAVAVIKSAS